MRWLLVLAWTLAISVHSFTSLRVNPRRISTTFFISHSEEASKRFIRLGSDAKNEVSNSDSAPLKRPTIRTKQRTQDEPCVPSYRQLLVFLSTTVLIWLSEPLLSLVDTTVVGWTPGRTAVTQLASLGPATTMYDSLLYMCYFLAIATTNKLAPAYAQKKYRELQITTSHVLGVSAVLGTLTTATVLFFGKSLLMNMVGSSADAADLVFYASRYASIRASVGIASIMGMVAQSFCLATLDTKTPVLAVAIASMVNVVGDITLRRFGVQGAAVATAVSSLLSSAVLLRAVRRRTKEWRTLELQQSAAMPMRNQTELLLTNESINNNNNKVVVDDPMQAKATPALPVPFVSLPDRKSLIELVKLSGPIFFVILAKIACYGAMTFRCIDFGVVSLAAHNIMMRVFFFYGTLGDSLSQTAQSFLPATLYPQPSRSAFRKILQRLLVVASVLAVSNSRLAVFILQNFGKYLASDHSIVRMMADHTHFFGLAVLVHPFIILLEGSVIAARDFRTLVQTYVVTLGLHFGILKFFCGSFPAVWRTFFLFQTIRLGNFGLQVWHKQREFQREESEGNGGGGGSIVVIG